MGVLEFIYKTLALLVGAFTILMTVTMITGQCKVNKIKKEYKHLKDIKEEN